MYILNLTYLWNIYKEFLEYTPAPVNSRYSFSYFSFNCVLVFNIDPRYLKPYSFSNSILFNCIVSLFSNLNPSHYHILQLYIIHKYLILLASLLNTITLNKFSTCFLRTLDYIYSVLSIIFVIKVVCIVYELRLWVCMCVYLIYMNI